jgi:hypothetical protein
VCAVRHSVRFNFKCFLVKGAGGLAASYGTVRLGRDVRIHGVRPFTFWLLLLSGLALAQQSGQKKDATPPPDQKQDSAPLFKSRLGYKSSSKNTKDSTTLGFNGIDPSGKVDQKMMATSTQTADQEKVKNMTENRPTAADLKSFLQEGGLNSK